MFLFINLDISVTVILAKKKRKKIKEMFYVKVHSLR